MSTSPRCSPSTDLAAIESFLGTAKAIRGDALKDPLAKVNSPDLNAEISPFAGVVETELRPILDSYGATMTRAEMKAHLQKAYDAYRDLSALVLTAAKDTEETVNDLQQRNSDSSCSFAANTTPINATELLPSANVLRASVENALAESGDGWVNKSLHSGSRRRPARSGQSRRSGPAAKYFERRSAKLFATSGRSSASAMCSRI